MPPIIKVGDQPILVPTSDFPHAKFKFEKFNPVQSRVLEYYNKDVNGLIAAATSAGKTIVAELMISDEIIRRGGKAMFLCPLRALAREKITDWQDPKHHFSNQNISICTGDYRLTKERANELNNANIIVMTSEMLSHRSGNYKSEQNSWLKEVGTLVIDECFPGGTKIRVEQNIDLPIKKIYENDQITHVMAYDHCTNSVVKKQIIRKIRKEKTNNLVCVKHEFGKFTCTENHKIWTENRGYVPAINLQQNDIIKWIPVSENLTCPICSCEFAKKRFLVSHYLYSHICPGKNTKHIKAIKKCNKCDEDISVYGYESHYKSCGVAKIAKYVPKTNVCSVCGKEFINALSRSAHEKHHLRTKDYYLKIGKILSNSVKYKLAMKEMGKKRRGFNNPIFRNPQSLEKVKQCGRERWKNLSEQEKMAQIQRFINAPRNKTYDTKLELFVEDVYKKYYFDIKKTSGGKFWVTFENGKRKNPDFLINEQKKVVEVGDVEYWHNEEEILSVVENYKLIGYDCLYLTNKDVELGELHVKNKLENFINNHSSKITEVKRWGHGGIEYVYDLEVEEVHNYFAEGTLVSNCHLLTVPGRGDHLEVGLMKFTEINPDARIILLSATMPNVEEIADWVSYSLTKRTTFCLQSQYRPVPLTIHYESYYDIGKYDQVEEEKVNKAMEIIEWYPDDKFLVFAHTKRTGELMKESLRQVGIETQFHNSDLNADERAKVEDRFKNDPKFRVIVATSTLAWGLNLPARRVIIMGVHRGISEVESHDILQMVGRSGRMGIDPMGDAYILIPETQEAKYRQKFSKSNRIESQLLSKVGDHHKTLAFHLVSEIHHDGVETIEDVHNWYKRSLAYFQNKALDETVVDKTLELLRKCGAIEQNENKWKCRTIGKVSSMFYFNPFDVSDLYFNFKSLFETGKEDDDYHLSIALANTDSQRMNIVSKIEKKEMENYSLKVKNMIPGTYLTDAALKAGFCYYSLLNGVNLQACATAQRGLQFDFNRVSQVLQALDSFGGNWGMEGFFKLLEGRIANGVPAHLVNLCRLPNIGKARATKLYAAGIKTVEAVADMDFDKFKTIINMKTESAKLIYEDAKRFALI